MAYRLAKSWQELKLKQKLKSIFMKKLIAIIAFAGIATGAFAQSTASHTIEVELVETLGISIVTDLVSQDAVVNPFVFNTQSEYTNGIEQLAGVSFGVTASVDWSLAFKSTDNNFENAGATATMPLNVLEIKETVGGAYAGLTTNDQVLTTGTPLLDILGLSAPVIVDYKVTPGTSYDPAVSYTHLTLPTSDLV